MAINLELSRLMTYRSAAEVDSGKRSSYWASIAKCFAADTAVQVKIKLKIKNLKIKKFRQL